MPAHVAILLRPYIRMMLDGRKTVESRLTRTTRAPFRAIEPGERIYFKASSGPYMATAVVDKVAFFDNLTPAAVAKLETRYNDRVCGDDAYWQWKRNSRYATFVLLRDVQATSFGPRMAPSQGIAWFIVDEAKCPAVFDVTLTDGALRNGYLRVPRKVYAFADAHYGGKTAAEAAKPIELVLPSNEIVQSDLVANGMLRRRGWASVYCEHNLRPGDTVRFLEEAAGRYHVRFVAGIRHAARA